GGRDTERGGFGDRFPEQIDQRILDALVLDTGGRQQELHRFLSRGRRPRTYIRGGGASPGCCIIFPRSRVPHGATTLRSSLTLTMSMPSTSNGFPVTGI